MNGRGRGWVAPVALGVALLSLALNLYLVDRLRRPERWAVPAAARALEGVLASDATVRYTVRLPAGTPLELDIPVNERFSIQLDTVIPIRTTVRVPIRTPVGTYGASVPIRANVPLRGVLPLHVRHTFELRTRTSQELAIPLEIRLRDLQLEELLESAGAPR